MASCARRVAVRRLECRRFGLGMENPFVVGRSSYVVSYACRFHRPTQADDERRATDDVLVLQLLSNVLQRFPARIFHRFGAVALSLIQVLAAMRTQAFAIFAADRFQGH